MKAVNQSIGRAVRHKDDYATILLVDERFNRNATKEALPDWIKRSLKVYDFQDTIINMRKVFFCLFNDYNISLINFISVF